MSPVRATETRRTHPHPKLLPSNFSLPHIHVFVYSFVYYFGSSIISAMRCNTCAMIKLCNCLSGLPMTLLFRKHQHNTYFNSCSHVVNCQQFDEE